MPAYPSFPTRSVEQSVAVVVVLIAVVATLLGACDIAAPSASREPRDPALVEAVQGMSSPADPRLPVRASEVQVDSTVTPGTLAVDVGEEARVPVRVTWRIPGVDTDDRTAVDVVTLRREPDGWTRLSPVRLPWGVEDPVAVTSSRCRVLGPPSLSAAVTAVHEACERSLPAVLEVWPSWHGAAVIVVSTSAFDPGTGARVEGAVSDGRPAPADRMLVDSAVVAALSEVGLDVLMRHELVHVAMRATGSAPVPVWFQEGLAVHIAYSQVEDGRSEQPAELRRLRELREFGRWRGSVPGPTEFEDPLARAPAYVAARLGVEVLMDAVGRDRLVAVVAGDGPGVAGPTGAVARPRGDEERTMWLLTQLGLSSEWLDREWALALDRRAAAAPPSP
ncbi:hypothetical protein GA707_16300 [Nostocoides sp. F2B08]|uniref:hypothetical protein n=1 Tax=Nostocoides sp. F2B08 TaxID=2653936 RepID=UPI001262B894|nr:hypothetical protein [Tetrasphaera sp. F2B08]KAB7742460.1 hypothetical protein GA707_16300 [Tetrasphaera sp. F2B08]